MRPSTKPSYSQLRLDPFLALPRIEAHQLANGLAKEPVVLVSCTPLDYGKPRVGVCLACHINLLPAEVVRVHQMCPDFGTAQQEPELCAHLGQLLPPLVAWDLARRKPRKVPDWVINIRRSSGSNGDTVH